MYLTIWQIEVSCGMDIKFFNSLGREKQIFKPIEKGKAGLYTCGPTVYDYQHIGNFRTFLFEDLLKRVLLYNGYSVKHIMNITDVGHLVSDGDTGEDKMEKGSAILRYVSTRDSNRTI